MINTNKIIIEQDGFNSLLHSDYQHAMLHMLWYIQRETRMRHLFFGMVEALPQEITPLPEALEQTALFKGNLRMFYIRKCMHLSRAMGIYQQAMQDWIINMAWDDVLPDGNLKKMATGPLVQATTWPDLLLANHEILPFIPVTWGMARVHSLLPPDVNKLHELFGRERIAKWINDRVLFDLITDESPFLGSLHLVLPNPLYRRMSKRLIPAGPEQKEAVQIRVHPRERKKQEILDNVSILLQEKRHTGFTAKHLPAVPGLIFTEELTGPAEKVSSLVFCTRRGILDGSEPAPFLRSVHVSLNIREARLVTTFSDASFQEKKRLIADKYREVEGIRVGENENLDEPARELGSRLSQARFTQKRRQAAAEYDQFYCNNPEEAKLKVLEILQQAKRRLVIIDPYFDDQCLYEFTLQVRKILLPITILTGADTLQKQSALALEAMTRPGFGCANIPVLPVCHEKRPVWSAMQSVLHEPDIKKHHDITIQVMTGDCIFHDRFLVVDDMVWFSGNSLNNIGKRRSMILKLPDPRPVLGDLNKFQNDASRVKDFHAWIQTKLTTGKGAD